VWENTEKDKTSQQMKSWQTGQCFLAASGLANLDGCSSFQPPIVSGTPR
jgi:hypothetical protein